MTVPPGVSGNIEALSKKYGKAPFFLGWHEIRQLLFEFLPEGVVEFNKQVKFWPRPIWPAGCTHYHSGAVQINKFSIQLLMDFIIKMVHMLQPCYEITVATINMCVTHDNVSTCRNAFFLRTMINQHFVYNICKSETRIIQLQRYASI